MADLSTKMVEACRMLTTFSIAQGWNVPDRDDLEIKARIFIDALDRAGVPAPQYMRLYHLATDVRAKAMRDGKQPPNFSAELLVSLWDGPNGLRARNAAESEVRRIEGGICPLCKGTGFVPYTPPDGRHPGVKRCRH